MTLFEVLGTEAESDCGPVRIDAMFAALPPKRGESRASTRDNFQGEVTDRHGRRWQAIVVNDEARLLRRIS